MKLTMEGKHREQSRCRSSTDGGAQRGDEGKVETSCTVGQFTPTRLACALSVLAGPSAGELVTAYIPLALLQRSLLRRSHHSKPPIYNASGHKFLRQNNSTFSTDSILKLSACYTIISLWQALRSLPNKRAKLSPKPSAPLAAAFPRCSHSSQTGLGTSIQLPFCMQTAGCNRHRQASTGIDGH